MNNEWIKDQGILPRLGISIQADPSRNEDAKSLLFNLKQYREYADTSSPDWRDYVLSIFHLFGFQSIWREQRLVTIGEIGNPDVPLATVVILNPYEDMFQAANGLAWGAYLFYAGKHFKTRWGLITNGRRLKLLDLGQPEPDPTSLTFELDEILTNEASEEFAILHFVLHSIRGVDLTIKMKVAVPQRPMTEYKELKLRLYSEMLTELIELRPKSVIKNPSAVKNYKFPSGKRGVTFEWSVDRGQLYVQIWISIGDTNINKNRFDALYAQKAQIDAELGFDINWNRRDETISSVINIYCPDPSHLSEDNFERVKQWGVSTMAAFVDVFRPCILALE